MIFNGGGVKMKKSVLVVDDNEQVLKTVSFILKDEGFDVVLARNGQECVDAVKNGFRGLILLDVMMPVLSGWEAVGELVKMSLSGNVIICMMTVVSDPKDEATRYSSYITGYLTKPFTDQSLIQAANEYHGYLPGIRQEVKNE